MGTLPGKERFVLGLRVGRTVEREILPDRSRGAQCLIVDAPFNEEAFAEFRAMGGRFGDWKEKGAGKMRGWRLPDHDHGWTIIDLLLKYYGAKTRPAKLVNGEIVRDE